MQETIRRINLERKRGHSYLTPRSEVYRAYLEMEKATFHDGALSKKHKELIAIALSVTSNCESCMQWHIEQALKDGADQEEIIDAIGVAIHMGVGPVTVNSRFATRVLDHLTSEAKDRQAEEVLSAQNL